MGVVRDLTGQRFGRLSVAQREGTARGRASWLCRCDCGTEKVVCSHDLLTSEAKAVRSCGCLLREETARKRGDLTGQRFAKLLVEGPAGGDGGGQALWSCRCDCGVKITAPGYALRAGYNRSCGCGLRAAQSAIAQRGDSAVDHAGQRFARLHVIERAGRRGGRAVWLCRCDCGTHTLVDGTSLRTNHIRSCGCLAVDSVVERFTTHGEAGADPTAEYTAWLGMNRRCKSQGASGWANYGGRGITVCERWQESFLAFLADMGRKPSPDHSIDRIDVNGHYEPGNCRWATFTEQNRNRRSSVMLTHDGKTLCATEWGERIGGNGATVTGRIERGWSVARAVSEPVRRPKIVVVAPAAAPHTPDTPMASGDWLW